MASSTFNVDDIDTLDVQTPYRRDADGQLKQPSWNLLRFVSLKKIILSYDILKLPSLFIKQALKHSHDYLIY